MRLLHSSQWRFKDFFDSSIEPYAILSHRWGLAEISYQELSLAIRNRGNRETIRLSGEGFDKIRKCREQAVRDNHEWIWVDTCCINKESSAELSEAINSMYRWYKKAAVCYIYMSDVDRDVVTYSGDIGTPDTPDFDDSAWFTRGWTLQELLAPRDAIFFDRSWESIGTRESFAKRINSKTDIPVECLDGDEVVLSQVSVACKLSWLAGRQTSRSEDMAYCMLGLLNVNMPLLYGEGMNAFKRLQLEFIRESDDESIFAWDLEDTQFSPSVDDTDGLKQLGMLASHPIAFENSRRVKRYAAWRKTQRVPYSMINYGVELNFGRLPYSMTNQGLELNFSELPPSYNGGLGPYHFIELNCYTDNPQEDEKDYADVPVAVVLKRLQGPIHYTRLKCITASIAKHLAVHRPPSGPVSLYIPQPRLLDP